MKQKNYIFIIAIVIILAIFGFWFFFFRGGPQQTVSTETNPNQNLFPYGENGSSTNQTTLGQNSTSTTIINETPSGVLPTLIHITTTPVAGAIFLPEGKNASSTVVRYIDRGTGHVYDYNILTGITSEVANTTMPEIYEGIFSPNGGQAIFRSLDANGAIQTVSAQINATTTPATPSTLSDIRFLPKNIVSISLNPAGKLFYIENSGGGSFGYISALDGTKSVDVWNSPLEQLTASWNDPQYIFVHTNPSASIPGYALILDSKTGNTTTIVNNAAGLATLENGSGTFAFGSETNNGTVQSFVLNVKKDTQTPVTIRTLADKCVWSVEDMTNVYCAVPTYIASNNMPDDWYQGTISLASDDIWKIDATTGMTTVLNFLSAQNSSLDAENLFLDTHEQWLGFIDKTDLSLWALRIQ